MTAAGRDLDVARARALTPGCETVAHFNNAGAALMPGPVLEAVTRHLEREAAIGGYEAAEEAAPAIARTYEEVAGLLGCGTDEVALVENATRAWDMAFYSFRLGPGDRVLTGRAEYASNVIALLQVARRTGARLEIVPDDEDGQISLAALERALERPAQLIALTHAPSNDGLVNPAAEVGRIARAHGVPFLLDACQSVGQIPLDVGELGCDALAATGRKYLRGPRGTGFLYVRHGMISELEPPFLDLHAAELISERAFRIREDARRFETWEASVASRLGLGVAVGNARAWGLEAIRARIESLAGRMRAALAEIPGVDVRDRGRVRSGIVTFTVAGTEPAGVRDALRAAGINVSVTKASHGLPDPARLETAEKVRASVHYYNTEQEIERLCAAVAEISRRAARR